MKALRVNKKLWTGAAIEEFNEAPACVKPIVVPYGVCGGCGCGCCCPFLCVVLIC